MLLLLRLLPSLTPGGRPLALAFDPSEPRVPGGRPGGGRWTRGRDSAEAAAVGESSVTTKKLGDCYDSAWNRTVYGEDAQALAKMMRKEVKLCHGYPTHPPTGKKMGHAWVEVGDLVMDHDMALPKRTYYAVGQIDPTTVTKYTAKQAMEQALKKGTYGPFEERIPGALFRDSQGLADLKPALRKELARIDRKYPAHDSEGKTTRQRYFDADDKPTPERKRLHDDIVSTELKGRESHEEPTFVMMGGGPASGKSTTLSSGAVSLPRGHIVVANDEYKTMLPEYKAMLKHGDDRAAAYVHEESGEVTKRVYAKALEAKNHVVLDGTGDNSLESLKKKLDQARATGHRVVGQYVTCDLDKALERSQARQKKTGRKMPEAVLRADHASVSRILPQAVKDGLFDEAHLWDTTDGGPPVHVMSATGKEMRVHDGERWRKFLKKGEP
jgi:predicted ABC-type ATPase